ncbi:MAG: hypothetical protein HYR56_00735 [Acidobacteria bacterium]|nr:hypothetical protein [Acidobacteriota bacterium]MBI3422661.1 hypothetical protein [Acidobacteriota bacterium]
MNRTPSKTIGIASLLLSICLGALGALGALGQATPAAQPDPLLDILSFKLVSYNNLLLQPSNANSADARDLPRTPAERVANAQRTTPRSPQERANEIGVPPGAAPTLKVISAAEWAYLTVKNTAAKPIKALTWEYAFLRMEQGQLLTQATIISQTEIKPGAKKTLRQPLPTGATRCQVISAREAAPVAGETKPFEYVCGRGFTDPSLLREKPAPVTLKRIEYADGSVWP